jgi:hypothetical protein
MIFREKLETLRLGWVCRFWAETPDNKMAAGPIDIEKFGFIFHPRLWAWM